MQPPVEAKVKAGTLAAAVSGVAVWLLGRYVLHGSVSQGYVAEIDVVIPAVLTAVAGWLAPHTPRPGATAAPQISVEQVYKFLSENFSAPAPPAPSPAPQPPTPAPTGKQAS